MKDKQALTTGEVAKYCGVNFRTVIRWIERGHLEAYKLPGRGDNRVPLASFLNFLEKNNMPVPEALSAQERQLIIYSQDDFGAELAALARRSGWEPLLTDDAIYFGGLLAQKLPAAILLTQSTAIASVNRILRTLELNHSLLLLLVTKEALSTELGDGWLHSQWPQDIERLQQQLDSL
ncbi:MAG: helix-turn-helix domain-containing protein [Venatoribacter sp.]